MGLLLSVLRIHDDGHGFVVTLLAVA